jgi:hypothetical protein
MAPFHTAHKAITLTIALAAVVVLGGPAVVGGQAPAPAAAVEPPTSTYWVYVGAESADLLHRIRFGPGGAVVEKTIPVGEFAAEMEGPHGLVIARDGQHLFLTTGHGFPDGKYWKYALGPDTLVGRGTLLGHFPASIDVTPDGLYTFSANFNLHGDMVPSTVSVVYTPTNTEIARVVTCVMPHGSRLDPSGRFQYSGCMMDDQLVEIDARAFTVARRFSLATGKEGPLPAEDAQAGQAGHAGHAMPGRPGRPGRPLTPAPPSTGVPVDPADVGYQDQGTPGRKHAMAPPSCSPTWAQPSADGATIFVACNKADAILEIDRARWALRRRLPTGRGPYNLAVTPDGRLLVATLKQGAGVEVLDLATGRSLARLPTATTVAHGVAVSPDSRYAFVSSEGVGAAPGKVDIYDLRALVKVGTVDVGQQAGGIAFWKMERATK